MSAIPSATLMTRDRSRFPSFRGFLKTPRVCGRNGEAASTAVHRSRIRSGHIRPRGPATSSNSIWPSTNATGLPEDFYHYDAGGHALMPIGVRTPELEALLTGAQFAMDAPASPQILITIAARFGRISWKYSSLAYALILKDVGVLTQTFYLMATDMGLGGCAIGTTNIDLFAKMTGIEFHVEGPVGQFALGRGSKSGVSN